MGLASLLATANLVDLRPEIWPQQQLDLDKNYCTHTITGFKSKENINN